jgi:adenine specific DNA methylase Mod
MCVCDILLSQLTPYIDEITGKHRSTMGQHMSYLQEYNGTAHEIFTDLKRRGEAFLNLLI